MKCCLNARICLPFEASLKALLVAFRALKGLFATLVVGRCE